MLIPLEWVEGPQAPAQWPAYRRYTTKTRLAWLV